jgi:hypothetical protein
VDAPKNKPKQSLVELEIIPGSGVDVVGKPPLLVAGERRSFTQKEADEILKYTLSGRVVVQIVSTQKDA